MTLRPRYLALTLSLLSAEAAAGTELPSEPLVEAPTAEPADLPCAPDVWLQGPDVSWLACGDQVFEVRTTEKGDHLVGPPTVARGHVRGLFHRSGRVWAEVVEVQAHPLQSAPPAMGVPSVASTNADAASPTVDSVAAVGEVVSIEGGVTVIDLGFADGLELGDRVELFGTEEVIVGGSASTQEVQLVVGEVVAVADDRAEVRLGRNEVAPVHSSARATDKQSTGSFTAPPRVGGLTTVKGTLRGLLSFADDGGGLLGQASVRHRFDAPLMLELRVNPVGFAAGGDPMARASAQLVTAFDSPLFGMGLGLGVGTFSGTGFGSVVQYIRFGAVDGLMIEGNVSFARIDGYWEADHIDSLALVPVAPKSRGAWIVFHGGGGAAEAFGEVGVRARVRGNGQAGTTTLTAVAGGASLWSRRARSGWDYYTGPTVGLTAEHTF